MNARQERLTDLLVAGAVVLAVGAPMFFTHDGFAQDCTNALWLIWVAGQHFGHSLWPSYFLNLNTSEHERRRLQSGVRVLWGPPVCGRRCPVGTAPQPRDSRLRALDGGGDVGGLRGMLVARPPVRRPRPARPRAADRPAHELVLRDRSLRSRRLGRVRGRVVDPADGRERGRSAARSALACVLRVDVRRLGPRLHRQPQHHARVGSDRARRGGGLCSPPTAPRGSLGIA